MEAQNALEYIDNLLFAHSGKRLNDLERDVFVGSWLGKTYSEIHPIHPQYIEKTVAYKLWQKISEAFGEKVTKKNIKGAVERRQNNQIHQKVLISYHHQEPDSTLAQILRDAIMIDGHQVFMTCIGLRCPQMMSAGTDWLHQIDNQLEQCDYLLLLLSPQAAISEILIEQLKVAQELRDSRHISKPVILPIRINCPSSFYFNHALRNYLVGTCQREWKSTQDTHIILKEILTFLSENIAWGEIKSSIISLEEWKIVGIEEWEKHTNIQPEILSPLPVAEPELPKGQVRLASAFYVKRVPHEDQCYKEIMHPGALIRIKAPRQMGKTSLMARILDQAKEQEYFTVPLSFQHADQAIFSNLNQLLRWFCTRIARKLHLPDQVDQYWTDTFGSKDNCTAFFEDCILPQTEMPLVLGLDEVDRVFQYPNIADDFFSLLRAWYEEASYGSVESELWEKLRLVIVHSTEVYIPLDINQSPFNVGLPIELSEFSAEQVNDLAQRHGLNWGASQIQTLMKIVGGHPYLVRVAMYYSIQEKLPLEKLVETAATESGIYGDHLRRHLWNLQRYPELAEAFSQVVISPEPIELKSVQAFKLHSMGLVHLQGNQVIPRFDLYRDYFSHHLSPEKLNSTSDIN